MELTTFEQQAYSATQMDYLWEQTAAKKGTWSLWTALVKQASNVTFTMFRYNNNRVVYVASSKSCEFKRFSWCWNKVNRKYIQEQLPTQFHCYNQNMGFVNRMDQSVANCRIGIRMKKKWWFLFVWMEDAVLQGALVLYRVNKDEGGESLPFLVFQDTYCQCNFS